jgi:hypothetical protein
MIGNLQFHHALAQSGVAVLISMPSATDVVQSLGIMIPASAAARSTVVPSGALTLRPSIVSVTLAGPLLRGVPKSF